MNNNNEYFLLITKLTDDISKGNETSPEYIFYNLFSDEQEEEILGVKYKRFNHLILIDGYRLFSDEKGKNLFEKFWQNLRNDKYSKYSNEASPILAWGQNKSGDIALLKKTFRKFFKEITNQKQSNFIVNLLIHFGGADAREEDYPKYIDKFFNSSSFFNGIEVYASPVSNVYRENQNNTFLQIIGDKDKVTLASVENNLKKLVSQNKEYFSRLENIKIAETIERGIDELWHLKIIEHPMTQPHVIYDESFKKFSFNHLELILNGIPTSRPPFLDKLFIHSVGNILVNVVYIHPNSFKKIALSKDKEIYKWVKKNEKGERIKVKEYEFGYIPTLFVGFFDFQNIEHCEKINELWDSRYRFFDSCIWFRYASLANNHQLKIVLGDIENYSKKNLYKYEASREFLEFQTRLFNNSYIEKIGRKGHHSGNVTPFSFHSEMKMKINADGKVKDLDGYSWNVLLVDDHSIDNPAFPERLNKSKEIKAVLNVQEEDTIQGAIKEKETVTVKTDDTEFQLNFIYCNNIAQAIEELKNPHFYYDLVLLDFLFDDDGGGVSYGHEFIIKLKKLFKLKNWDKIWIMPISVYHNALIDNLRDEMIPLYDEHLIISEGADPICTPELFRHRLFSFLSLQKEELIKIRTLESKDTFEDILDKLEQEKKLFEELCKKSFSKIVKLGTSFSRLIDMKEKKSSFAETALKKKFFDLKNKKDWYHIQNLFYLLAFGNKYQYPQIQLELLSIYKNIDNKNPLFKKLENLVNKKLTSNLNSGNDSR